MHVPKDSYKTNQNANQNPANPVIPVRVKALINIFKIVIVPLNQLGIPMRVAAVTGNHDRDGSQKTFNNPGEENFTHIIYNTLRDFCEIGGLKNIEFIIAKDPWAIIKIYENSMSLCGN